MKKKTMGVLIALVLVLTCAVGGTLAYLMDKDGPVKNTFTVGNVDITLTETPNTEDGKWEAQLVPGTTYDKDPTVTVVRENTNVDCYLFVKFEENGNPAEYLTYTSTLTTDNGWAQLEGYNNVWYRIVSKDATEISWKLLAELNGTENKEVLVKTDLTKENMPTVTPELVYTAYAVQKDNLTVTKAWEEVNK